MKRHILVIGSLVVMLLFFLGISFGYFISRPTEKILPAVKVQENEKIETSQLSHSSFFSYKNFFEDVFETAQMQKISNEKNISSMIVNHHLLAPDLIAKTFRAVSSVKPKVVILISPDHLNTSPYNITTSGYNWSTAYGRLEANQKIISELVNTQLVFIKEKPFESEHGISNIVSFIKKTFPAATFIPIIIQERASQDETRVLAETLHTLLPKNSLVVGSFDFSHYLPKQVADIHDEYSMEILNTLSYNDARRVDIDSQAGLETLLYYSRLRQSASFHLVGHSSAADRIKNPDTQENTSYITGYFSANAHPVDSSSAISIITAGDLFLDRYIRNIIDQKGKMYPFTLVERLFLGADISMVNLEGPFTDFPPKPLSPENTTFTFDPSLAPILSKIGINLVSLSNNHTLNYGTEGLKQTKNYLEKTRIDFFGDPNNAPENIFIKEVRGKKIGFIGYHSLFNSDTNPIIKEIQSLQEKTDYIIIFSHWGNEYTRMPSSSQKKAAHEFIDSGADIVLGSHPHVIQPVEIYNGKMIFYSLGNFLFDQSFPGTKEGLAVGIILYENKTEFSLFPTKIENLQTKLITGKERDSILEEISRNSQVLPEFREQIKNGKIVLIKF